MKRIQNKSYFLGALRGDQSGSFEQSGVGIKKDCLRVCWVDSRNNRVKLVLNIHQMWNPIKHTATIKTKTLLFCFQILNDKLRKGMNIKCFSYLIQHVKKSV